MTAAAFQPALLVFLKYPAPGRVKTRLAADLGPHAAARLYRRWIELVFRQLQPLRPDYRLLALYDGAPLGRFAPWLPLADRWLPQHHGNLGQRLDAAFRQIQLDEPGTAVPSYPRPACAIGTDCLELDPPLIRQAFQLLGTCDVVLGPAYDGGYYLIGTAAFCPRLFDNIRWSTPWTLDDQIRQCRQLGCSYACLPPRRDIDTLDDWRALRHPPSPH